MSRYAFGAAVWIFCAVAITSAGEPTPIQVLPNPRPMTTTRYYGGPMINPDQAFIRENPYDAWQYYGVGSNGAFRPRVAYNNCGSYYLYNGAPFPWVAEYQREAVPVISGTPYRYPIPWLVD